MNHDRTPSEALDADLAAAVRKAYAAEVDVETAARHLWMLHREAGAVQVPAHAPTATASADATSALDAQVRDGDASAAAAPSRRHLGRRALAPMLVGLMMVSSSGVAVAASQTSLPGDVLYVVKRGTERAQLLLARSPQTEAALQVRFARIRFEELLLIAESRPQHVPELLEDVQLALSIAESTDEAVVPQAASLRREVEEEVAALHLSTDIAVTISAPATEVDAVTTAAPVQGGVTTTAPAPSTAAPPSATPGPTDGPAANEADGATASEEPTPSDAPSGDGAVGTTLPGSGGTAPTVPGAAPQGGSVSPSPSPSGSASPSESGSPSESPSPSPSESGSPSESPSPSGTGRPPSPPAGTGGGGGLDPVPTASPSPSPSPSPSTSSNETGTLHGETSPESPPPDDPEDADGAEDAEAADDAEAPDDREAADDRGAADDDADDGDAVWDPSSVDRFRPRPWR